MKAKKDENINYYYTNRHAVYLLQYHLVVVTKYRHKVINNELKDRLIEISYSIIESDWKSKIISINTDEDHVHILFETDKTVPCTSKTLTVASFVIPKSTAHTFCSKISLLDNST